MKTPKIIRRENVANQFTTVHHSILLDNNLSPIAFRVLTLILSNSDNFKINQKYFIQTLKVNKKTVQKAFKNLEECGYMKRTELSRGYSYTISEYGNLNSEPKIMNKVQEPKVLEPITVEPESIQEPIIIETPKLNIGDFTQEILDAMPSQYTDDELINILSYLTNAIDEGRLTTKEQLSKSNLEKIVKKFVNVVPVSESEKKAALTEIKSYIETLAVGNQITIAIKKVIVDKAMDWVASQDLATLTEKGLKNKVLTIKSAYITSGHLDQKYQN